MFSRPLSCCIKLCAAQPVGKKTQTFEVNPKGDDVRVLDLRHDLKRLSPAERRPSPAPCRLREGVEDVECRAL